MGGVAGGEGLMTACKVVKTASLTQFVPLTLYLIHIVSVVPAGTSTGKLAGELRMDEDRKELSVDHSI